MKYLKNNISQVITKVQWIKIITVVFILFVISVILCVFFHNPPQPNHNDSRQVVIVDDITKDFLGDGWDLFGWSSFVFALCSLILAFITWAAQNETEKHTRKAPISSQLNKLRDLARHFYRNLVCTIACIWRFNNSNNIESGKRKCYPSESNLRKLQTLPDDVVMDIDTDDRDYSSLHELKLLLRNYNVEIDVASEHLSRNNITDESLVQDFDNLIYKPLYLLENGLGVENRLTKSNEDYISFLILRSMYDIVIEHFTKLKIKENFNLLRNNRDINVSTCISELLSRDPDDHSLCVSEDIDFKRGLKRSFEFFVRKLKSDKDKGLEIIKGENNEKKRCIIKKVTFIQHLKGYISNVKLAHDSIKSKELCEYIDMIIAPDNKNKILENVEEKSLFCYDGLNNYFSYLAKDEWDFFTLFNYMIAIDVVIETDRIGMINY